MSASNTLSPVLLRELKPHSFIYEVPNVLSPAFCQNMIARFEQHSEEQYQGRIGQTQQQDQQIKRSTDLVLSGKPHWHDVDRALFRSLAVVLREFQQGLQLIL